MATLAEQMQGERMARVALSMFAEPNDAATGRVLAQVGEIETLEAEIAADQARMNEPDFFRQPPEQIKDFQTALADKEQKVLDMMTRWEELLEKEAQVNASRGR